MTYDFTPSNSCDVELPGPSLQDICNASSFFLFMSILDKLVRANNKISGRCERIKPIEKPDIEYDFIVIGGGGTGAVVASRLSEIHDWKILLLEAGHDEPAGGAIPSFNEDLIHTELAWDYRTSNEPYACLSTNRSCYWAAAKCLGGGTAHNGMVYLRGNPKDYDNWAAMGNEGWSWEEVKRFYISSEDNGEIERVGTKYHGTGGPIPIERFPYLDPIGYAILDAAEELGYGISEDLNGDVRTGFANIQATNKRGVRRSSAAIYLRPARNRKNLHISLNTFVTRILFENLTAVGVEYQKNGQLKTVRAKREIILSGGAVGSPSILLRSGIGPEEQLNSLDIPVVKDLPGVGENLHDHVSYGVIFTVNQSDTYDNNWPAAAEYLAFQTGPLSTIGLSSIVSAFASSATTPDDPDIQHFVSGYLAGCSPGEVGALRDTGKKYVTIYAGYTHPKSRGYVKLISKDPFKYPVILANYLSEPSDVQGLLEAINMTLEFPKSKALKAYNFTLAHKPIEACSNCTFGSNEYWDCAIRQDTAPEWHLGGSCKMGPSSDHMAVVNNKLQVYGINGLRVADNSIMPQVTSANTAAPAMVIGERAADFIKKHWESKN